MGPRRGRVYLGSPDEALRLLDQSIDEATALFGPLDYRVFLRVREATDFELSLDQAERDYERVERADRANPNIKTIDRAITHGMVGAALALARHEPQHAEALAREALASLRELSRDRGTDAALIRDELARSLVDQRRWREALAVSDAALAAARTEPLRDDLLANLQVTWAIAAGELGRRDEAIALLGQAHDTLARFPANFDAIDLARCRRAIDHLKR